MKTVLVGSAAVAALLSVAVPAGAQSSAPAAPTAQMTVEQQVQGLLKYNKGAKQTGRNTVRLAPGVVATVRDNRSAYASWPWDGFGCRAGYLCLWEHANMSGASIDFTNCRTENLWGYRTPSGSYWADRVSSYSNNQTGSVTSRFYDGGVEILNEGATGYRRNLQYDKVIGGNGYANDRIDSVRVC
ncbi:peptidase inhibitor family I36 protein [Streptomyces sp. 12297]